MCCYVFVGILWINNASTVTGIYVEITYNDLCDMWIVIYSFPNKGSEQNLEDVDDTVKSDQMNRIVICEFLSTYFFHETVIGS